MKGNTWATARCRVCGREIIARDNWAYKVGYGKRNFIYFCSWKHLREWRAGKIRTEKARKLKRGESV